MILFFFSETLAVSAQNKAGKLGFKTVCIDAGHGGHDPGCISRDGTKTKEKDIALSIALYVRDMIKSSMPEVKPVLTRSDDHFVELAERANIANRNNADLFVSIHVNAVDPKLSKKWQTPRGFSIHTLGQSRTGRDLFSSNMDLVKRENSVILLENDYTTKYQGFNPSDPESYIFFNLMQNANLGQSLAFAETVNRELSKGPISHNRGLSQDPFYVLWKTTMPAVLIECGFITNPSDLAVMKTESGRKAIAEKIFRAIKSFKKSYDASMNISSKESNITEKEEKTAEKSESHSDDKDKVAENPKDSSSTPTDSVAGIYYGTQILATGKRMKLSDKSFKGEDVKEIKVGSLYKYIIGISSDRKEAENNFKKFKQIFPGSFLTSFEEK